MPRILSGFIILSDVDLAKDNNIVSQSPFNGQKFI